MPYAYLTNLIQKSKTASFLRKELKILGFTFTFSRTINVLTEHIFKIVFFTYSLYSYYFVLVSGVQHND